MRDDGHRSRGCERLGEMTGNKQAWLCLIAPAVLLATTGVGIGLGTSWWAAAAILVCLPGVVDAALRAGQVGRARRAWRVVSLGWAILLSVAVAWAGSMTIVLGVFGLASAYCTVLLLRAERGITERPRW